MRLWYLWYLMVPYPCGNGYGEFLAALCLAIATDEETMKPVLYY